MSMALPITDDTTLTLWQVAENGDVDELALLLPRVTDINAQNEHGVTALMRAAQHGQVKMVRALLEHGADPRLSRNDKFTALALAAFFGHIEVVKDLIEHGADAHAVTRGGVSPVMWATARTFTDVANQLEKARATTQAPPRTTASPVVKTLKDPPEIWDLVHEVPRGFNARAAFVSRLKSVSGGLAFGIVAVVLLIGCSLGLLIFKGAEVRSEARAPAAPVNLDHESSTEVAPVVNVPAALEPAPVSVREKVEDRTPVTTPTRRSHKAPARSAGQKTAVREVSATATPAVAKSTPLRISETPIKSNAVPTLSPQLITPAKSASPKAKVIQWP